MTAIKITAVNSQGQEDCIQQCCDAAVTYVDFADASEAVGNEDLIIIFFDQETETAIPVLQQVQGKLKFKDIPVILAAPENITDILHREGIDPLYHHITTPLDQEKLRKLILSSTQPVGNSTEKIDSQMIAPFIQAMISVFETMAGITGIVKKEILLKKDYKMLGEISGVMVLKGSGNGSIAISLTNALARIVTGNMLDVPPDELEQPDVHDGVGELVNMVAGSAKTFFQKTPYQFDISLPTVISGAGHEIQHPRGAPCIVLVFEVENEEFALQISLEGDK